ncbi:MAG: phospholipase A [Alistipes sp.]|nr:phospholipase A [Alistipes sp.]
MKRVLMILFAVVFSLSASAKSGDSIVVKQKSRYPVIGMWKQNYMVTGFATNKPVSKFSSDIKFQLSLALRLWSIKGEVDIFATYSQRSIWNVYQKSCPFLETAYNPGFWVAWQTNEKVRLLFGIEHESNGYDGDTSRSFNYATVACLYDPHPNWSLGARAWYGYYDRENISRYFHYRGVMQLWGTFHTRNDRFSVTALVNPTVTFTRYNLQVEAAWRMAKRGDWIPSLFVQYCYGYGETMIDYNRRTTKIRLGISLMNRKMNLY